jgi:hypothetical protein
VRSGLEEVSEVVERLKQLCIEKGLMDAAKSLIEEPGRDEVLHLESGEKSQKSIGGG